MRTEDEDRLGDQIQFQGLSGASVGSLRFGVQVDAKGVGDT
jgi:hypothetical protein